MFVSLPPIRSSRDLRCAFSVTELVVTISILGTLAALIITSFGGLVTSSREVFAERKVELLNEALNRHATAGRPLARVPQAGSDQDELLVLLALQMRREDLVGSPFVSPLYVPNPSSSDEDYRLRYNGVRFELLKPGQIGTGLKVAFDGSDVGPARTIPPGFDPYGR